VTTDRRPCPACERAGRDADGCAARPKCLTHRHPIHLDTWGICADCHAEIVAHLRALPGLVAQAHHHLVPGSTGEHIAAGVPGSRPPLNIAALDLACGEWLLMTDEDTEEPPWTGLEGWEQDWRTVLHLSPYGPASAHRTALGQSTLVGVVGFLIANLERAAAIHPAIDEFATDVRRMHAAALNALHMTRFDVDPDPDAAEPPDYVIPCPADADDAGHLCGHRIPMHRLARPVDGEREPSVTVNCPKCGSHWTVERLLRVAHAAGVPWPTSVDHAADQLGIAPMTLRRAIARGEVGKTGRHVDMVAVWAWSATRRRVDAG
jgi:hypothetical protein